MSSFTLAALLAAATVTLPAPAGSFPHAQALADRVVTGNPGMIDAILHVSPALGAPNVVVAAHLRQANGELSGDDDLGVARTGAPLVEVQKDGVRLGILVQLRDAGHHPIGALGLMYRYRPGDDIEAQVRRSFAVRDELAKRIGSRESLMQG